MELGEWGKEKRRIEDNESLGGYVTSLLLLSLKLELARPQLLKIRVCELNKGEMG